jgi:hypothetical protein
VNLKELELSEEPGDVKHTQKLIDALDPHKKTIGQMPDGIPAPGDVRHFYREPADCWRSRYLAVKGLSEFALDVDKFLKQERYQSHSKKEREEFKNARAFLFWKDLASADEFSPGRQGHFRPSGHGDAADAPGASHPQLQRDQNLRQAGRVDPIFLDCPGRLQIRDARGTRRQSPGPIHCGPTLPVTRANRRDSRPIPTANVAFARSSTGCLPWTRSNT